MAEIRLRGAKELLQKFKQLEDSIAGATLEKAALAGAEIVREDASRRAPRRTGNLAKNIVTETAEKSRTKAVVNVGPNKKAWYGRFVELGTSKMAPKPYLMPAFEANKRKAEQVIRDVIKRELGP